VSAPVAVIAIGNRSRGDDAAAPLLLDRLRAWLAREGREGEVDLLEEYQLQVENALDLEDRRLALFIDARSDAREPVTFTAVTESLALSGPSSHALDPGAVLSAYRIVARKAPPPAFALAIAGAAFELGAPLSPACAAALEQAWEWLQWLLARPTARDWRTMAATARALRAQPA